jgi:hypothetical protein
LLLTHTEEKSAEIKRRYAMKLQQLLYGAGMIACMLPSGCAHYPESREQRPVYILKPWKWEQRIAARNIGRRELNPESLIGESG